MSCIDEIQMCVTRGDIYALNVGLFSGFDEVEAAPGDYVANLVFRDEQSDSVTPYLTLTAAPEANPNCLPTEPKIYLNFTATAAETQSLPDWDHVAYCELVKSGATPEPRRLFNGKVDVHD